TIRERDDEGGSRREREGADGSGKLHAEPGRSACGPWSRLWPVRACSLPLPVGCAHYTPAPLDPVATAQAYTARRVDAPDVREWLAAHGSTPAAHGWTAADLSLVALYY